jgi:hypothetical protein
LPRAKDSSTLRGMDESDLVPPCALKFWTFAGPVLLGNLAMLGVGALANAYYKTEPHTTRQTAIAFAKLGTFWLVAGGAWIALNRRNGAAK